ncbi:sortase [Chloroflexi bacterium TSY]|nr:sortase [Chloroflexi bacterium TSY]
MLKSLFAVLLQLMLFVLILSSCVTSTARSVNESSQEMMDGVGDKVELVVEKIDPLASEEALPPVQLQIPDIALDTDIVLMGWQVTIENGERTTVWDVPDVEAGWHVNSAGAGAVGNAIISGHQAVGESVFAPIALGEVEEGQDILLTDQDGLTFAYKVIEVTEPIPIAGATAEDRARATSYLAPTELPTLTLMTGWPEFTTTHYLFVVAKLEGIVKS